MCSMTLDAEEVRGPPSARVNPAQRAEAARQAHDALARRIEQVQKAPR